MKDVANDEILKSGDIIAISESRLVPNDRGEDFLLPGFNMYRFDAHVASEGRPFNGMVLYSKKELPNPRKFILCGVETVIASIDYRDASVNLLFIYCRINMASISNFCKFLRSIHQLISRETQILTSSLREISVHIWKD